MVLPSLKTWYVALGQKWVYMGSEKRKFENWNDLRWEEIPDGRTTLFEVWPNGRTGREREPQEPRSITFRSPYVLYLYLNRLLSFLPFFHTIFIWCILTHFPGFSLEGAFHRNKFPVPQSWVTVPAARLARTLLPVLLIKTILLYYCLSPCLCHLSPRARRMGSHLTSSQFYPKHPFDVNWYSTITFWIIWLNTCKYVLHIDENMYWLWWKVWWHIILHPPFNHPL